MAHPDLPLAEGTHVTYSSGRAPPSSSAESAASSPPPPPPDLRILHYNDVYHLDPSSAEPVGGIARFVTVCKEYRSDPRYEGQPELVTFFSGDVFNPSLESTVTKGAHMVPVLNTIGTDCACVGNHDFDFGIGQFRALTAKTTFPWLIANVLDPALGPDAPIGGARKTHVMTTSNGIKIGLLGLGEREWLATINSLPPDLVYKSATETAKEIVPQLRARGVDIVVCLSHMREPNDIKLARQTEGLIDIILGGHDHFYAHSVVNGTHVLRSGSDFKQLSYIEARRAGDGGKWDFDIFRRDIVSSVAPDAETQELANSLTSKLHAKLGKPVGWTASPLDARFTTVRTRESNIGNLVCDVMRSYHGADCAIVASGTVRGDQIYPPGAIRLRDITNCFPFEDPVVFLRIEGRAIRGALENSVSLHPALEGRFPQVSNIRFAFDPARPAGNRILSVSIGGEPLDDDRKYTLATRGYMGRGKDGYDDLLVRSEGGTVEEIVCEENGILISTMLRQYFMGLRTVGQWKKLSPCWTALATECGSPVAARDEARAAGSGRPPSRPATSAGEPRTWEEWLDRRRGLDIQAGDANDSDDEDIVDTRRPAEDNRDDDRIAWEVLVMRKYWGRWVEKAHVRPKVCDPADEEAARVDWTRVVAPVVEGRIRMVG